MKLSSQSGLASLIEKETAGQAATYLDGGKLSVHWYGASKSQIYRLKVLIANYIDVHMLMDSYSSVNFFT